MTDRCEHCDGDGALPCDCPYDGGCFTGGTHIPGVVVCFACDGTGRQPYTGRTGWGHERRPGTRQAVEEAIGRAKDNRPWEEAR